MRYLVSLLFIAFIVSISSCRKDFETVPSSGNLGFSKDTVYLDTVFTRTGSSTYTLKVYNRSNDDINIPNIRLAKSDSKYRMMIDGLTGIDADNNGIGDGKVFNNIELLAKDSLYVFIEVTDSREISELIPTEFLYTDEILFDSKNGTQKVNLVTLIKDAYFLYPKRNAEGIKENLLLGTDKNGDEVRINGFELDNNDPINGNEFEFNNTKPYVIYGYAGVPNGQTLTVQPGARVYFHAESGIVVQPGASLNIAGTASPDSNPQQNEITFEGDRLEPLYEDIPGQWGTIWLRDGSTSNIKHLTLKNATVGLLVENSTLNIEDSQIYNSANYGILARTATMENCKNLVINLAGQATFACSKGGSYDFRHCTFNNNWASSNQLAVLLSNYEEQADGSNIAVPLTKANFYNCIIYGNNNIEFYLDDVKDGATAFEYDLKYCLFKFRDFGTSLQYNHPEYDFIRNGETNGITNGNTRNKDPKFYDVNFNKLNISDDSEGGAYQKGSIDYIIPTDVLGHTRTSNPPDLGAYQSAAFPE